VYAAQLFGVSRCGDFGQAEVILKIAQVGFCLRPQVLEGVHGVCVGC